MRKRGLLWIWLACTVLPVQAAEITGLYTAEIPVADQSREARDEALREALARVLVRVTGNSDVPESEAAEPILARAGSLMQQYGYRGSDASGFTLRVTFNDDSLARALSEAGLPIWGRERPQTLVWLALDGERLATAAGPAEVVYAMTEVAENRGIELTFPGEDAMESGRVTVGDIRAGNDARVATVSRGYGVSHLLIGEISGSDEDWTGRWRLLHEGRPLESWRDQADSRDVLLAAAVNRGADIYARRFAIYTGGAPADAVPVGVRGIGGAEDYLRVTRYLAGLTAVESVSPILIEDDAAVFRVRVSGGADSLGRGIGLADWLVADTSARDFAGFYAAGGQALGYRLDTP